MHTRRELLRLIALAGGAVATAGVAASCSRGGSGGGGADVTLKVSGGWPYGPMPTKKDRNADPVQEAYAEVLQDWMDKNPGVTLKNVTVNVWDQEALTTAVTGGSAPSMYPGNVLGGWDDSATRSAFVQGMAADVTDTVKSYAFGTKIASYAKPIWRSWLVNDKYFAAPSAYNVGNGIYYRRDLVQEAGLTEPAPGWTWPDVATLAAGLTQGHRKGVALQSWGLGWWLGANGYDLLTQVPAPDTSWNWTWSYTAQKDTWVPIVEAFRKMIFTDKSVLSDVSFTDSQVTEAFSQGRAAMMPNNAGFFLGDPDTDNTPAHLARQMKKPIEDVVGWMQHPVGAHGHFGNTQAFMTLLSFSPDLNDDGLDKSASLHDWMTFGKAYARQKKAVWDDSHDLQRVFTDVTPVNGMSDLEGVPGTAEQAWGPTYMKAVREAAGIPLVPATSQYFPVEDNPGPSDTASSDAQSKWTYEQGDMDVAADLAKLQRVRNKQAASFSSSISDDDFVASARRYYDAHKQFWADHAPEFSKQVFDDWYTRTVQPALG